MFVTFSVPFVHGKARPRFARMGRGVRAYTNRATAEAEDRMRIAYEGACLRKFGRVMTAPGHVPVTVSVSTRRALPKSRPKRIIREIDAFKPDIDNVLKSVLDALNGVAWVDDAQVVNVHAFKLDRMRGATDVTTVLVMWEEE
jgi:Holliday junction resolvase RusA-like endonuclease